MKKLVLLSIIISVIGFSCKRSDDNDTLSFCGGKSLDDLPWFKDIRDGKTECTIYPMAVITQHEYNNQTVFYLSNGATSLGVCMNSLYDCSGNLISGGWTDEQWANFKSTHTKGKIIWTKSK